MKLFKLKLKLYVRVTQTSREATTGTEQRYTYPILLYLETIFSNEHGGSISYQVQFLFKFCSVGGKVVHVCMSEMSKWFDVHFAIS